MPRAHPRAECPVGVRVRGRHEERRGGRELAPAARECGLVWSGVVWYVTRPQVREKPVFWRCFAYATSPRFASTYETPGVNVECGGQLLENQGMPHAPVRCPMTKRPGRFLGCLRSTTTPLLLSVLSTQDADSAASADVAAYGMDHADRRSAHRRCRRIPRSEPTETASLVTLLPASPEPMP